MRLSRTSLELLAVGALVALVNLRFVVVWDWLNVVKLGPLSMTILSLGGAVFVAGIPFAYAYRAGRDGRAGTPRTIATQFLGVGVVAGTLRFAVVLVVRFDSLSESTLVPTLLSWFSSVGHVSITIVLAGLAGVPLGAMAGFDDAEGVETDAVGVQRPKSPPPEQADGSDA